MIYFNKVNLPFSIQEIRERLMAEEQLGDREWEDSNKQQGRKKGRKYRKSEVVNKVQRLDVRRLSLPATLTVSHWQEVVFGLHRSYKATYRCTLHVIL